MEKNDIEFLLERSKWISVFPLGDVWKGCIYKKLKSGNWKIEHSRKFKCPKKCWEWIEIKFEKYERL